MRILGMRALTCREFGCAPGFEWPPWGLDGRRHWRKQRGIGEAIVLTAAAEGDNVVVDFVAHPDETTALIARVEAAGGPAVGVEADVSQLADLHAKIEKAIKSYGRLDVLIKTPESIRALHYSTPRKLISPRRLPI